MRLKFLHGLDDDMREQALSSFWQKNKVFIIAGVLTLFVGYGASGFYQNYKASLAQKEAALFYTAFVENSSEGYQKALEGEELTGTMAALAHFQHAQKSIENNEITQAQEAYKSIINTPAVPKLWKELAVLLQAEILSGEQNPQAKELLTRLIDKNSIYKESAYERLATIALQEKDYEAAQGYYEYLLSAEMPPQHQARIKDKVTYLKGQGLWSMHNTQQEK